MTKTEFNLLIQKAFQLKLMEVIDEFQHKERPDDVDLTDVSFAVGSALASALYEQVRTEDQGAQMTVEQADEFEFYCRQLHEGFVGKVVFLVYSPLVFAELNNSQLQ